MSDKKYVVYYHEKVNEYFYDYYSRFNMNEQYSKPVLYSDDFQLVVQKMLSLVLLYFYIYYYIKIIFYYQALDIIFSFISAFNCKALINARLE